MSKSAILAALRAADVPLKQARSQKVQPHSDLSDLDWLLANFKASKTSWQACRVSKAGEAIATWWRSHRRGKKMPEPIVVTEQAQQWLTRRRQKGRIELQLYANPQQKQPFGLSMADAALAETGSLVMHSSPANPAAMQFLSDHHCVLLKRSSIFRYYEDYWMALGQQAATLRAINWISGPSRTADVEQTLQLGAHGPLSLHVVVLEQ